MEINSNADYFAIHPPRLEDAGLEDSALSFEGIQEAFRRAAEVVKPRTIDLLPNTSRECTENPGPSTGEWQDAVLDASSIAQENGVSGVDTQAAGVIEGQDIVINVGNQHMEGTILEGENVGPKLGEKGCVEGEHDQEIQGSKTAIGDVGGADDAPSLTGAYL